MTRIFYWIFYVKDGSHVRLWHPSCVYITAHETVHCSTKDVYTSEITFLALRPWYGLDSWYILLINYHKNCVHCTKIPAWTIRLYVLFPVFNGANINTNINILLTYIHNIPTIFLSISFCLFVSEEMGWGGGVKIHFAILHKQKNILIINIVEYGLA